LDGNCPAVYAFDLALLCKQLEVTARGCLTDLKQVTYLGHIDTRPPFNLGQNITLPFNI
jgi:hypothetical protein